MRKVERLGLRSGQRGQQTRQVFPAVVASCMDDHRLTGQNARIHAADGRQTQEAILDARNHQTDGIHVSGQQHRGARRIGNAPFERMDRTQAAQVNFISQRSPMLCNEAGCCSLAARKPRHRKQGFQQREEIGH